MERRTILLKTLKIFQVHSLSINAHKLPRPVSYTHLDVYKRQYLLCLCNIGWDEPISGQSRSDWHSLCSKSRVAPLRQVSLPRIELCACLLLSRLVSKVIPALYSFIDNVHLYSDSMVALYWIHAQSTRCLLYPSRCV